MLTTEPIIVDCFWHTVQSHRDMAIIRNLNLVRIIVFLCALHHSNTSPVRIKKIVT